MNAAPISLTHIQDRLLQHLQRALPHLSSRDGELAWADRWPDASPEGRKSLRESLRRQLDELAEVASTEPHMRADISALQHLLQREIRQLEGALKCRELLQICNFGLKYPFTHQQTSLLESTGLLVQRLRALPAFLDGAREALDPEDWQTHLLQEGLNALAHWLSHGAEEMLARSDEGLALLRREKKGATACLREFSAGLKSLQSTAAIPAGLEALQELWQFESTRRFHLERLKTRLQKEFETRSTRLKHHCQQLGKRYGLRAMGEEELLSESMNQLCQDTPRIENWQSYQNFQLQKLHGLLIQSGLIDSCPCSQITWMDYNSSSEWQWHVALPGQSSELQAPDIATWSTKDQESFCRDRNTWSMQIDMQREIVPGRLWLMQNSTSSPLRKLLCRSEDLDGWTQLVGRLLTELHLGQSESRYRVFEQRETLRDLVKARIDLLWHSASISEDECLALLRGQAWMPDWLARISLSHIQQNPGRALLAVERQRELKELHKALLRNWQEQGDPANILAAMASVADLPARWLEEHGPSLTPGSRRLREMPTPIPEIKSAARDELVQSVEAQLAALGRINLDDLEAGREFDPCVPQGDAETHDQSDAQAEGANTPEPTLANEGSEQAAETSDGLEDEGDPR